jgi:hypothetical protein
VIEFVVETHQHAGPCGGGEPRNSGSRVDGYCRARTAADDCIDLLLDKSIGLPYFVFRLGGVDYDHLDLINISNAH